MNASARCLTQGLYLMASDCCYFYNYRSKAVIMTSSRKFPKQPVASSQCFQPPPPTPGSGFPPPPRRSLGAPHPEWHSITWQQERSQELDGRALDSAQWLWLPSRLLENVLLPPLLEHILDAYLSYCKMYVTKQSGISLTIIPFMPHLGISWPRVRCQPQGPWHKG